MIRRLLLPLVLLASSCTPPPPRPAVVPAQPQLAANAVARRVVLLSFDGMGADALARQQNLPAFERLAHEGASARIINVNPTLTAPTHISMLTGADPQRHGVVSNRFHLEGTPIEQHARGMETDPEVETIVEAARRQGKRVGAVSFPNVDGRTPRRTADFGMAWTTSVAPARIVTLSRKDFKREWVPPTWTQRPQRRASFSPVQRARIEWSVPKTALRMDVDVVAYDTTNDARENYDAYFIESEEREISVDDRGWFALSMPTTQGVHGSWSKFLRNAPTLDVTIYWGAISRNEAWPESFHAMLDEEVGFWPGSPDEASPIDAQTFIEQLERLDDFYTRAQTLTIARVPFDLLLAYHAAIDQASHQYLGRDEEAAVLRAAFASADRAVSAVAETLNPEDALVVTGDHGLVPLSREVRINRLLADHGFTPRWRGYASGAHVHFYRFEGADDADALIAMLNASGLFERVQKKNAQFHRNAGDVIAWAWPNVAVAQSDHEPAIVTPQPEGQHGLLNTHREMHPPLFAIGHGTPVGPLGEIAQTKIARFVAQLLGIAPPAAAD